MTTPPIGRQPLALMISLALLTPGVAGATTTPPADCNPATEQCDPQRSGKGWLWGGLAALAVGAAAGGGGGGVSTASGDGGSGGGGTPPPTPQPGGQFGNGQVLVGAGGHDQWQQPVTTRINGDVRNEGTLQLTAGTLHIQGEGELRNNGTLDLQAGTQLRIDGDGDLDNFGTLRVAGDLQIAGESSLENHRQAVFIGANVMMSADSEFENRGTLHIEGGQWALQGRAEIENTGTISARGTFANGALFTASAQRYGNDRDAIAVLENRGHIDLSGDASVLRLRADEHAAHAINHRNARMTSTARNVAMMHAEGGMATLLNQGTLTITGDNAVAMRGERGATLINDGTINLGTSTDSSGRGMIAMSSDGSATLNNRRGGVINIHGSDSFAFRMDTAGHGRLINNGIVNIHGRNSGIFADATTAAADRPGTPDLGWQAPRGVRGYTVGTHADGSAGQLVLHDGGELLDVAVDTGFTRGTDASSVLLKDVVLGADGGEQNIHSASVVWQAQGHRNEHGSVDVVMQRQDYRELADASQQELAAALEGSYRNNALYHSLELADRAQFQTALGQLSGAGLLDGAMRLASNADAVWSRLAHLRVDTPHVLGFGGGNSSSLDVRGQGTALQLAVPLKGGRTLQVISAGLRGDLSNRGSSDSAQTWLAGVGLAQQWGRLQLRHQLGHELHQMQDQRSLAWSGVSERARSERRFSRTLLSSTLSDQFSHGNLHWQPRLKAAAFDYREDGFSEAGAGGFGLRVDAGNLRGVSLEMGSALQYRLSDRWQLQTDTALTKPVLSHAGQRQARLHGAASQAFTLRGLQVSGLDHRAALSADYQHARFSLGLQMLRQRLWGQSDLQADLRLAYPFR